MVVPEQDATSTAKKAIAINLKKIVINLIKKP
jgi:hypothetical protein